VQALGDGEGTFDEGVMTQHGVQRQDHVQQVQSASHLQQKDIFFEFSEKEEMKRPDNSALVPEVNSSPVHVVEREVWPAVALRHAALALLVDSLAADLLVQRDADGGAQCRLHQLCIERKVEPGSEANRTQNLCRK